MAPGRYGIRVTSPAQTPPAPFWGDGSRRKTLLGALTDSAGMIGSALRLFTRHWPAMLALFLAGALGRELVTRAAVQLSLVSVELALLVLLLAPMCFLTALVLMLRVVRPSLHLAAEPDSAPPPVLAHLGSVLIPFIGIYDWEGQLLADIRDYNTRVFYDFYDRMWVNLDESIESGADLQLPADALDRQPAELTVALVAVAVVAFAARALLSRWSLPERHRWLGLPGAYLELVWLFIGLIVALRATQQSVLSWVSTRQIVDSVSSVWEELTSWGVFAALGWFVEQLGNADASIALPIFWLVVSAIVLGHRRTLVPEAPPEVVRRRQSYERAQAHWQSVPGVLRWLTVTSTQSLQDRFVPLGQSLRLLIRGGIAPMLLFCLVFVAVKTLAYWLWELQRLLIGPRDPDSVWYPLIWPLAALNQAVGYVVLICLLAAAVDRTVRATSGGRPAGQATSNRT